MNNRGQVLFFTFMIEVCVFLLALAFAPVLKQSVENSRGSMDCNNESISDFNKLACISSDVSLFSFIIGMICLAGLIIGARVIIRENE